jgi:O-antigen/teichoic acid export membrane protein
MKLSNKINKLIVLRYVGIFFEVLYGFVQPNLFSRYQTKENFAFFLILYGSAIYFVFMDAGLGRLSYSQIRKEFIDNNFNYKKNISTIISVYLYVLLIIISLYFLYSLFISNSLANTVLPLTLFLFSIYVGINIIFSYLRSIFNAVDKYLMFEKYDFLRKVVNLLSIFLVIIDHSLLLTIIVNIVFICLLIFLLLYKLIRKLDISFSFSYKECVFFVKSNIQDSKDIIIFSLCEALIYNGGFLLFPYFLSTFDTIIYGLWMKVFMGFAVLMRAIADISIHSITEAFHKNNNKLMLVLFKNTLTISCLVGVGLTAIFYFLDDMLFKYWVGTEYLFSTLLFLSFVVFFLGNCIQHSAGIFIMSLGSYFSFMRTRSMFICLFSIIVTLITLKVFRSIEITLLVFSIVYLIGSLTYLRKAFLIMSSKTL